MSLLWGHFLRTVPTGMDTCPFLTTGTYNYLRKWQFKLKAQQQRMGDDALWKLLVRKVLSAKTISSLSLPKRKREEELRETMGGHALRTFRFC
ncbi:hypothetical protein SCA6_004191 [Theobroma cacao]